MAVENESDAEKAACKLIQSGIEKVIISLGAKGAFAVTKTEIVSVPAFKVEAVDTTAAGDTFCGAFAVALVDGKSLKESLLFASAAAAICITRIGAQPSAPARKEIDANLLRYEARINIRLLI